MRVYVCLSVQCTANWDDENELGAIGAEIQPFNLRPTALHRSQSASSDLLTQLTEVRDINVFPYSIFTKIKCIKECE